MPVLEIQGPKSPDQHLRRTPCSERNYELEEPESQIRLQGGDEVVTLPSILYLVPDQGLQKTTYL